MTTEELMDLMYRPIYDEKMLKVMEEFEMEIPKLDEQYKLELIIGTYSDDKSLAFEFKEIDGYSKTGEPILAIISWENNKRISYPFDLQSTDSYKICCKKFGRKADFIDEWDDSIKTWLIEYYEKKIHINVNFNNVELDGINCLVLTTYDETEIGEIYIPNEE